MKNVFSVFDGMSCLQQALNRSGIQFERYYASEIDKHAIKVTQANFPNTIQLGSIVDINPEDFDEIDFFAGGSPCQSFSFAGKRKGMSTKDEIEIITLEQYLQLKSEGFEFEGQSYLFWEYMRLLTAFRKKNPNIKFLLENVMMGEKWEKILTRAIGVNPIEINSALVSAQNRRRLYWTNIGMVPAGLFGDMESVIDQPTDLGIFLKDILETEVDEKYFLKQETVGKLLEWEKRNKENGNGFRVEFKTADSKSEVLSTGSMKSSSTFLKIGRDGKVKNNQDKASCFTAGANSGEINGIDFDKINTLTTGSSKDNLILQEQTEIKATMLGRSQAWVMPENDGKKSYTVCANQPYGVKLNTRIRRLTPTECERLQTVEVGYTNHVSDTQRYRMLGNGWTVDVIVHILKYL